MQQEWGTYHEEAMHTFRFNPVFRHWVLLGNPVSHEVHLESAHLLHSGTKAEFLAAVNPKQPFVMDPPRSPGTALTLYNEQPPLGEYELLLYSGQLSFAAWKVKEWEQWLALVQHRILHVHHNPHLHHIEIALHTGWAASVGNEYQRVGDLIATSHPIAGSVPLLEHEIIEKLRRTERGYIIHDGDDGLIYAPSAPLFEKEVWYVPHHQDGAFEHLSPAIRTHTAEALALIMKGMLTEWPEEHFVLELNTELVDKREDASWWVRIYQETRQVPATLQVRPLPEKFVRDLAYILGPGQA